MSFVDSLKRELTTAQLLYGTLRWTKPAAKENGTLVPDDLEASVDRHGDKVAFRFQGRLTSYRELDAIANRYARWALSLGLKPGDCVALFMSNRPEYVAAWYGLSKVGVVTALINNQLSGDSLMHCLRISSANHVVFGESEAGAIKSSLEMLVDDYTLWSADNSEDWAEPLHAALSALSDARPSRSHRSGVRSGDTSLMIYTSGTTGLPKAAKMSHMRVRHYMRSFIAVCGTTARDRVYITLPLYHSTGGLCGVGSALLTGASIILRQKFSASEFWKEASEQGATIFVYVGELCRYLLNHAPSDFDRAHRIRTAFGNGLRADVWEDFTTRFGIPVMKEFYGATEGNVGLINFDGKVGAVGRVPPWLRAPFQNIRIVRFDTDSETQVRGAEGLCEECDFGETGEMIGRIGDQARMRYDGYGDESATQTKILRDVFEKGDAWFRTGDLMKRDKDGYIYFVDRIGDTFRWKGENVATGEVATVLGRFPGVGHANVYGVSIPGHDGRAGMAAITPSGNIEFDDLQAFLDERLPHYAQPLFLRIQGEAETTGTLKFKKATLVKDGFDPDRVADPVWFRNPDRKRYEPLTPDLFDTIVAGGFRL